MDKVQARVYRDLEAAGLDVSSVNVQRPTVEDVYRFTLRGGR